MGPGNPGPTHDPALDPDVLEELELWGDADEEPADGEHDPDPTTGRGALVLVGTPIGNLGDLSPRAVESLRSADMIYCEDTRHSRKLLTHAGVAGGRLRSLHGHNENDRVDEVLDAVRRGETVAVVSDAGMPGLSDPGGRVVAAAARADLAVTVVPGPSAAVAALVVSGLPGERFCFEGFLPRSGRERGDRLRAVAGETRTSVVFEAPGRLAGTLQDLASVCGDHRSVTVARELTKLHEEVWRGSLGEASDWAAGRTVRGEVVIVLAGDSAPEPTVADDVLTDALKERLQAGERTRGAVDDISEVFGVSRRHVYKLALSLKDPVPDGSGAGRNRGAGPEPAAPGGAPE